MAKPTHTIMSHKLAQALIESGMHHFDGGGGVGGGTTSNNDPNWGLIGGAAGAGAAAGSVVPGVGTVAGGAAGAAIGASGPLASLLTTQNQYQAGLAPSMQSNYGNLINAASGNSLNGYGRSQEIQYQQQQLADALLAQSRGEGPNPALAQLNETTGQNVANQGALMAGQRGASANPALMARQAAMQGAATQQQAVGQGATMRAQQQIAAQQALQNQQSLMGGQNIKEQEVNNSLFGSAAGAQNAQNETNVKNYGMAQGINSQIAQNNANTVNKMQSGIIGGAAAIFAKGGTVQLPDHLHKIALIYHPKKYADGGSIGGILGSSSSGGSIHTPYAPDFSNAASLGSSSPLSFGGSKTQTVNSSPTTNVSSLTQNSSSASDTGIPQIDKNSSSIDDLAQGGKIPGKASVKGDSYKNDRVPALLSPGEAVLPRSVTQSPDAPNKAYDFVRHLQENEGKQTGYSKVAQSKKTLKQRVEQLEKMCSGGMA